jgi:polar amino acid transport system ATP-binding protein
MLKINNLTKTFANITAVDNISLNIEKNSIIGLAGPSGCGKSTLLRCIQGLEKIYSGNIELNGKTGFMFQDFQLFPHMNVLENITFALNIQNKKKEENQKSAFKLLKKLSLENYAVAYPHQLSGGQKQRVAFARTLIMHPDIILCDEPTSGLDISSTEDIIELLKTVKEMGMTMLIASHDIDFLKKLVEYIYILKNGEIISKLHPKDIKSAEEYMQLFI